MALHVEAHRELSRPQCEVAIRNRKELRAANGLPVAGAQRYVQDGAPEGFRWGYAHLAAVVLRIAPEIDDAHILHQLGHAAAGIGSQQRFVQRLNADVPQVFGRASC